ncbi:MAG: cytochrome c-type biogenesis protein CcmH [Gemmatimonadaceae bacterium]|jgi:cytochrome c-type biogenesis protein CcmH|nr:cytochrome c-type biogenesis protein CcmH [Gemmatimonadaceae bacterium]
MSGGTVTVAGRRDFLAALGVGAAALVVAPRLGAQSGQPSAASNVEMDQSAYKPVSRPPKPNAVRQMSDAQRDVMEKGMKCACPCQLDVFTCRTTDFSCGISPAMHRDVVKLIEGGYTADEIIAAFEGVYGERIRMAPPAEGFNVAGYVVPFVTLGTGAIVLYAMLKRWRANAAAVPAPVAAASAVSGVDASADELRRLQAALREDGRR